MTQRRSEKMHAVMKVLGEYDLDSTALWDCHGTPVILHKALETIQAKAGITFDPPQVIEADAKGKTAVLCVTGRLGDRSEWSIGEATPANNKNAYPFAMAEKRAKDRVILKLINLHGDAYSEDEADDFKEANPDLAQKGPSRNVQARNLYSELQERLDGATDLADLGATWKAMQAQVLELPTQWRDDIIARKDAVKAAMQERAGEFVYD